jgi:hypothetical protein
MDEVKKTMKDLDRHMKEIDSQIRGIGKRQKKESESTEKAIRGVLENPVIRHHVAKAIGAAVLLDTVKKLEKAGRKPRKL